MSYSFVDSFRAAAGSGWKILILLLESCLQTCMTYTVAITISSSRIRMFHRKLSVWHIPLLSVQWITPDDGQRKCPKHVEFHFQNKFENLVHLVGFIIRKYILHLLTIYFSACDVCTRTVIEITRINTCGIINGFTFVSCICNTMSRHSHCAHFNVV
jgi:hypothetical protein